VIYLENQTTFSGSDIKVYAYTDISEIKNFVDQPEVGEKPSLKEERELQERRFFDEEDPFLRMNPEDVDDFLDESLGGVSRQDEKGISTNKVSPTYVDIVKYGSDRAALDLLENTNKLNPTLEKIIQMMKKVLVA
jgi:hypothetical protein